MEAPESLDNRDCGSDGACSLSTGEDEVQAAPAAAPAAGSASIVGSPIVADDAEDSEDEDEDARLQDDAAAIDASYDSRNDLALADINIFIDSISADISQLDTTLDDLQDDNFSLCTEEEELRKLSIEAYPIGKLPRHNKQGVHQDQMNGVRGLKTPLSELFRLSAVGKLKAMTTIGKL